MRLCSNSARSRASLARSAACAARCSVTSRTYTESPLSEGNARTAVHRPLACVKCSNSTGAPVSMARRYCRPTSESTATGNASQRHRPRRVSRGCPMNASPSRLMNVNRHSRSKEKNTSWMRSCASRRRASARYASALA